MNVNMHLNVNVDVRSNATPETISRYWTIRRGMEQIFSHEKLDVYKRAAEFLASVERKLLLRIVYILSALTLQQFVPRPKHS